VSDPRALWAAAAGQSKRKSVTLIWPELAAALGGETAAEEADPQPDCARCAPERYQDGTRWISFARARTATGEPVCLRHAAKTDRPQRVAGWTEFRRVLS
jgi:hypothetical protein